MSAEEVLVLTPEDDLNNQNESSEKEKIAIYEPNDVVNINVSQSEKHDLDDSNANANVDDLFKSDENGEILESGEIDEIKNNNVSHAIDENLLNEMKYLFKNTRYFLIKSNNYENVQLAQSKVS